ncbi:hypothetical protein K435DRAFT_583354, partial [Dendrothele bispora CBS 962.96]
LSPELTREIQVTIYVLFISTGILTWDILSHLLDDYHMLAKEPLRTLIIIYFISRISCIGMLLTGFFTGPAEMDINCHITGIFLRIFFFLIVASTLGLFCLRARAICREHPFLRALLLVLWLASVGSCSVGFFVGDATESPDKGVSSCIAILDDHFEAAVVVAIAAMVHDTAVFVIISWKMYKFICTPNHDTRKVVVFFIPTHNDISPLLRCILQDGQLFYLISLFWEVLVTILALTPSLGPYYRFFMLPVHLIIVNSMACHVFRNVR